MEQQANVLTLVGDPLTDAAIAGICDQAGIAKTHMHQLAPDRAVDIPFSGLMPAAVNAKLEPVLAEHGVDGYAQAAAGRRKKLLIADMDSTIIDVECVDEMADALGLKPKIAAITAAAMRGELEFADALRQRVALLTGMAASQLQDVYRERIAIRPGARVLIGTMAKHGAVTALVSGGFTFFTERVVAAVGFQHHQANVLDIEDGRLTGKVCEPILDANAKVSALQGFMQQHGLAAEACMTIGDGANDIPMLGLAGLGIAFHATPKTRAATSARIDHTDLTTGLYYQGYQQDAFADAA